MSCLKYAERTDAPRSVKELLSWISEWARDLSDGGKLEMGESSGSVLDPPTARISSPSSNCWIDEVWSSPQLADLRRGIGSGSM